MKINILEKAVEVSDDEFMFYYNMENAEIRIIIESGGEVYIHTFDHPRFRKFIDLFKKFTEVTYDELQKELRKQA